MMLKSLIKVLFVIAVVIVSVIPVGAVNEPTAPTEIETEIVTEVVTEQVTEQVTEITTDIATEQVTDAVDYMEEEHIKDVYAGFYIVIFGVANLVGIRLAQSFSFWKW